ncbi:MAG: helix-turn-helix domain-containing protein [Solobacterium sp.]|nr:helix-turn-helix domain-containing protein [Solobacterium sp.]
MNSNIGKHISQRRKELGLTQEMLAERLHVTRQSVSNYETARSQPDIEMLKALAEALDTDIETLLYGTPKPPVTADPALVPVLAETGLSAALAAAVWILQNILTKRISFNDIYLWANQIVLQYILAPLAIGILLYQTARLIMILTKKQLPDKVSKIMHIALLVIPAVICMILLIGSVELIRSTTDPAYYEIIYDENQMISQTTHLPYSSFCYDVLMRAMHPKSVLSLWLYAFFFLAGLCAPKPAKLRRPVLAASAAILILLGTAGIHAHLPLLSLKASDPTDAYYSLARPVTVIFTVWQEKDGVLRKGTTWRRDPLSYIQSIHYRDQKIRIGNDIPFIVDDSEAEQSFSFRKWLLLSKEEKIIGSSQSLNHDLDSLRKASPEGLMIITARKDD